MRKGGPKVAALLGFGVLATAPAGRMGAQAHDSVAAGRHVGGIHIDHAPVGCVVAEEHPLFEARLDPADEVREGRLHFRPAGGRHWYSVVMEGRGQAFTAILPKPSRTLQSLDYYLEVTAKNLVSSRTKEYSPRVAAGLAACRDRKVAGTLGSAILAVAGPAGAPGAPLVPAGFLTSGVTAASGSVASAGGGAVSGTGGAAASGGATAAADGSSHGAVAVVAGAAALAGGVVALSQTGGGDVEGPHTVHLSLSGGCRLSSPSVRARDTVILQTDVGNWNSASETQTAIAHESATIAVDGAPVTPVRYEVRTTGCAHWDGTPAPACAGALADWLATAGTHVATGIWTLPWDALHTCELHVSQ